VHPFHVDVSRRTEVVEAVDAIEKIAPIDVNLTGYFFTAQAVCKCMAKGKKGTVVNMASKNGLAGEFGYTHYDSSKGGIIMLTKTISLELAHLGIRVNAVCPGYLVTPLSASIDSRWVGRSIGLPGRTRSCGSKSRQSPAPPRDCGSPQADLVNGAWPY